MKIVLSRCDGESLEIKLDGKQLKRDLFTKEMDEKLTISDFIGLGLSIMFLLALSQSMQIEFDNPRDTDGI